MLLSGAAGLSSFMPTSIQRALAIEPAPGSSWADAEHIVILMQENRSFDHCFGTLQGVRGFNDPGPLLCQTGSLSGCKPTRQVKHTRRSASI